MLIESVHFVIVMDSWRSSSHWLLTLISNRFNGVGLGKLLYNLDELYCANFTSNHQPMHATM